MLSCFAGRVGGAGFSRLPFPWGLSFEFYFFSNVLPQRGSRPGVLTPCGLNLKALSFAEPSSTRMATFVSSLPCCWFCLQHVTSAGSLVLLRPGPALVDLTQHISISYNKSIGGFYSGPEVTRVPVPSVDPGPCSVPGPLTGTWYSEMFPYTKEVINAESWEPSRCPNN